MSEIGKAIDQVARDGLAGILRADGFRKKGRTWRRAQHPDVVHVINVQASTSNAGSHGQCTLNAGVYIPALAERLNTFPVTKSPSESECHLRRRPIVLAPGNIDGWISLDGADAASIATAATELRDVYERYGRPWLANHAELRAVRDALVREGRNWWAAA